MTPEEKAIEQAAKINAGFDPTIEIDYDERYFNGIKCDKYDSWKSGAKSPEAKAYWQKGMYSEEEVRQLFIRLEEANVYDAVLWFNQNKKR